MKITLFPFSKSILNKGETLYFFVQQIQQMLLLLTNSTYVNFVQQKIHLLILLSDGDYDYDYEYDCDYECECVIYYVYKLQRKRCTHSRPTSILKIKSYLRSNKACQALKRRMSVKKVKNLCSATLTDQERAGTGIKSRRSSNKGNMGSSSAFQYTRPFLLRQGQADFLFFSSDNKH